MGGFAWVTLATNDSYSLGALVLAHSLRNAGTAHQLAVLITPGVSSSMREQLATVFDAVVPVDVMDSKDEAHLALLKRPELGITFTKIHCWRLTQFEKCVFLDADTLVVRNCDELFERDEFSAAPDVGWPDCFNSGVFVFRPSEETFKQLIQFAADKGSFDGGDQGLLNQFFSTWATDDIKKHLPFVYNLTSVAFYSYLPAFKQYGSETRIIHFIGPVKPWLQAIDPSTRTVSPSSDSAHLQPLLQQWWDLFISKVHPGLSTSLEFASGMLHPSDPTACSHDPPSDSTFALENLAPAPSFPDPYTPYIEQDDWRQINLPYQPFQVVSNEGELLNITFADFARESNDFNGEENTNEVVEVICPVHGDSRDPIDEKPDESHEPENSSDNTIIQDYIDEPSKEEESAPTVDEPEYVAEPSPYDYYHFVPDEACINAYLDYKLQEYQPSENYLSTAQAPTPCNDFSETYSLPRFLTIPEDDSRQSQNIHSWEAHEEHNPTHLGHTYVETAERHEETVYNHREPSPQRQPTPPPQIRNPSPPPPANSQTVFEEQPLLERSKSMSNLLFDVADTTSFPAVNQWKSQPEVNENETPKKFTMPGLKPLKPKVKSPSTVETVPKYTESTEVNMINYYTDPFGPPVDKIGFVEREIIKKTKSKNNLLNLLITQNPIPPSTSSSKPSALVSKSAEIDGNEYIDLSECKRQSGNMPKPPEPTNPSEEKLSVPDGSKSRRRIKKKTTRRLVEKWKPPEARAVENVDDILKRLTDMSIGFTPPKPHLPEIRTSKQPCNFVNYRNHVADQQKTIDKGFSAVNSVAGNTESPSSSIINESSSIQLFRGRTPNFQTPDEGLASSNVRISDDELIQLKSVPPGRITSQTSSHPSGNKRKRERRSSRFGPLDFDDSLDPGETSNVEKEVPAIVVQSASPGDEELNRTFLVDTRETPSLTSKQKSEENELSSSIEPGTGKILDQPCETIDTLPDVETVGENYFSSSDNLGDDIAMLKQPTAKLVQDSVIKRKPDEDRSSENIKPIVEASGIEQSSVFLTKDGSEMAITADNVLASNIYNGTLVHTENSVLDCIVESSNVNKENDNFLNECSVETPTESSEVCKAVVTNNEFAESPRDQCDLHTISDKAELIPKSNLQTNSKIQESDTSYTRDNNDENNTQNLKETLVGLSETTGDVNFLNNVNCTSVKLGHTDIEDNLVRIDPTIKIIQDTSESDIRIASTEDTGDNEVSNDNHLKVVAAISEVSQQVEDLSLSGDISSENSEPSSSSVNDSVIPITESSILTVDSYRNNIFLDESVEPCIVSEEDNAVISASLNGGSVSDSGTISKSSFDEIPRNSEVKSDDLPQPSDVISSMLDECFEEILQNLVDDTSPCPETVSVNQPDCDQHTNGVESPSLVDNVEAVKSAFPNITSYASVAKTVATEVVNRTEKSNVRVFTSKGVQNGIKTKRTENKRKSNVNVLPKTQSVVTTAPSSSVSKVVKRKVDRSVELPVNRYELLEEDAPMPITPEPKRIKKTPQPLNNPLPLTASTDTVVETDAVDNVDNFIVSEAEDNSGIAGAIAQLSLDPKSPSSTAADPSVAQTDYLRRQSWETGNMDYMGRDSFANVWSKIAETLSEQPDPEVPADQTGTELAQLHPVSLAMILNPNDPDSIETLPCDATISPGEEADDDVIFERQQESNHGLPGILEEMEEGEEDAGRASKESSSKQTNLFPAELTTTQNTIDLCVDIVNLSENVGAEIEISSDNCDFNDTQNTDQKLDVEISVVLSADETGNDTLDNIQGTGNLSNVEDALSQEAYTSPVEEEGDADSIIRVSSTIESVISKNGNEIDYNSLDSTVDNFGICLTDGETITTTIVTSSAGDTTVASIDISNNEEIKPEVTSYFENAPEDSEISPIAETLAFIVDTENIRVTDVAVEASSIMQLEQTSTNEAFEDETDAEPLNDSSLISEETEQSKLAEVLNENDASGEETIDNAQPISYSDGSSDQVENLINSGGSSSPVGNEQLQVAAEALEMSSSDVLGNDGNPNLLQETLDIQQDLQKSQIVVGGPSGSADITYEQSVGSKKEFSRISQNLEVDNNSETSQVPPLSLGAESTSAFVAYKPLTKEKSGKETSRRQSTAEDGKEKKGMLTKILEFVGVVKKKDSIDSSSAIFYDDPETTHVDPENTIQQDESVASIQNILKETDLSTITDGASENVGGKKRSPSPRLSLASVPNTQIITATPPMSPEYQQKLENDPKALTVDNTILETPPVVEKKTPILDEMEIAPDIEQPLVLESCIIDDNARLLEGTSHGNVSTNLDIEPTGMIVPACSENEKNEDVLEAVSTTLVISHWRDSGNTPIKIVSEVSELRVEDVDENVRIPIVRFDETSDAQCDSFHSFASDEEDTDEKAGRTKFNAASDVSEGNHKACEIDKNKVLSELDDIILKAKLIAEEQLEIEPGPLYSDVSKTMQQTELPPVALSTDFEELRVTSEADRKKLNEKPITSKLSEQILKAIPPPRRKPITDAKRLEGHSVDVILQQPLNISTTETSSSSTLESVDPLAHGPPPVPPRRRNRSKQRGDPQPPPKRKTKK